MKALICIPCLLTGGNELVIKKKQLYTQLS